MKCKCGAEIPLENVSYTNGTNEEGEEYGNCQAYCDVCKKDYEYNQWGHFDSEEDAIEEMKNYIEN